jgi:hypothetical protein
MRQIRRYRFTRLVRLLRFMSSGHDDFWQGGYHELVHEPDGMSERLTSECIAWIEAHIPPKASSSPSLQPAVLPESKL